MTTASIMPPDAGIPVPPGDSRLDALIRLPPGRKRQDEVTRIIAELAESLAPLHAAGRVHGGIYPAALVFAGTKDGVASDGVALDRTVPDASSQAMLATPPVQPVPDAEDAPRHAGYAAFEQYTDDPAYPCGPWTDVYGLAALAYFLATGSTPPSALARRVRDDYRPMEEWGANGYGKAFCDAVDSGLAMPAHARPQTLAAFAAAMGALPLREPTVVPVVPPKIALPDEEEPVLPVADTVAQTPPEYAPRRRPRALPWILACLLLLAAGGYAWMQTAPPPVQLASTQQAPAQTPEASAPAFAPTPAPQPPDAAPAAPAAAPDAAVEASGSVPASATTAPPTTASETPPDAAPKAPPKAAPVAVRVAVRPWGEVLVNGRSRGVSPPLRELSLTPGRYQVTVRNASAGEHRMTLTVAAGKPAAISHEFK
ncbi:MULTISPECIES: hypothetical protein [Achromobacter]|uniref:Protein kinase domain-containing protein n=1 Tax=Achromobacter spanius TaxID=217203 RepID=A0ABY8GPE7_9BURK|nr:MULTISPECIES: hypothetical protein [Achromobacter]WAI84303.1 hypothetical protein N8Z00_04275 [Achromobacter spanius]WEX94385.1 hypothetical protein N3Z32_28035 [Achromobacter sp. SS2-2022]WFP06453.1 hypothetical protein P8T11_19225 [Achromobacter spanius]